MSTTKSMTTAAEFETIAGRLGPCELVRGEVVNMSPAGWRHSEICACVAFRLTEWARRSKGGRVLAGEAGIVVNTDPDTVRGADIVYCSFGRVPSGSEPDGFLSAPPELVVEVRGMGQSWSELVDKTGEYLRMGVDRVWIVDPDTRSVHVYRSDAAPVILSESDAIANDEILPGFSCGVAEFFED